MCVLLSGCALPHCCLGASSPVDEDGWVCPQDADFNTNRVMSVLQALCVVVLRPVQVTQAWLTRMTGCACKMLTSTPTTRNGLDG